MDKKILITGVAGYIGSVAAYTFLQADFKVVGVDNFSTGFKGAVDFLKTKFPDSFSFYQLDLKDDLSDVFAQNLEAVVHFAAFTSVDESVKNPFKYFRNNVYGSLNLIETMVKFKVLNLVFSSTCAVYGEARYIPVDEAHPTSPVNPYGESKLIIEKIIKWSKLNYLIFRYFNVCGASDDGLVGDSKKPSVHLVQNAVRGALRLDQFKVTASQVDTEDKTPIRDYLNVVDLAQGHLKGVEYLLNGGKSEVINLGTGSGSSVLEIIDKVKQITGVSFELGQAESRKGEYAKMVAKIDKAKQLLSWEPQRTLETSVNSLVKWYKLHPGGWEN